MYLYTILLRASTVRRYMLRAGESECRAANIGATPWERGGGLRKTHRCDTRPPLLSDSRHLGRPNTMGYARERGLGVWQEGRYA